MAGALGHHFPPHRDNREQCPLCPITCAQSAAKAAPSRAGAGPPAQGEQAGDRQDSTSTTARFLDSEFREVLTPMLTISAAVVRTLSIIIALALSACIAISPTPPAVMAQPSAPASAPNSWFYGHPAPAISAAAAMKGWHDCIAAAAARLDDHKSSVMDIALAIEPLCMTKENTMIDAINREYLEKNPGIAANMSLTEMERVRQEARTNFRQTIGTFILALRKPVLPAARPPPASAEPFMSLPI